MKFPKQFLLDLLDAWGRHPSKDPDCPIVAAEDDGKVGRWSIGYSFVFKHEGKHYRASYQVGATECQDEAPWEYDGQEVECPEVQAVTKSVTTWETIK